MNYRFNSQVQLGAKIPDFTQIEVKNEPMLFGCDFSHAWDLGGPITKEFLKTLPEDWKNAKDLITDSRVHMLMPGFWPCIPGNHLDDLPRELPNGQPNHRNPSYLAEHVMCLVNGEVAPTEFALGEAEFPEISEGEKYYKVWHPIVEEKVKAGELSKFCAPSNQLIYFNCHTWHQGVQAVKNGWRWFIRCSRNTGRKPNNEIRRQVQVYLSEPMEGW